MHLSPLKEIEADFGEFEAKAGMHCVGDWHAHPGGDDRPSEVDLRAWAGGLGTGLYRYIGLIATPDIPGSTWPVLTAWVTQRDGRDGLVCERAMIVETLGW